MLRSLTAALLVFGCASSPTSPTAPPPVGAARVLFLGNSLTYTWDVPALVKAMADAAGRADLTVKSVTYDSYALEDHWSFGTGKGELQSGAYDFVVMQQGPSTLASSGINLTQWASTWSDEARRVGTQPGLYVVWPPAGGNLDAGIANYESAASSAKAALYPVGEAWREAWRRDPTMPLYGPDQFHPGQHGAWLAALVIVAVVLDRPVADFPNTFPVQITPIQEQRLREAATLAIARYARR
ncbi:MAG: hypothetical protein ABJC19_06710 [Gemmatimonadota bacterium]